MEDYIDIDIRSGNNGNWFKLSCEPKWDEQGDMFFLEELDMNDYVIQTECFSTFEDAREAFVEATKDSGQKYFGITNVRTFTLATNEVFTFGQTDESGVMMHFLRMVDENGKQIDYIETYNKNLIKEKVENYLNGDTGKS